MKLSRPGQVARSTTRAPHIRPSAIAGRPEQAWQRRIACYRSAAQGAGTQLLHNKSSTMADHVTTTIAVRGCNIKLMRGGSGPPLLFLHGASGAGAWLPFMQALAGRFEVIVPE